MATLLLVDDDEGIREVLRLYATRFGLNVVGEAVNGRQAVDMAARLQPHVIILDQEMPEMAGLEALPRLRRRAPRCKIVLYAAGRSSETEAKALALGAVAYCTKAMSPQTLMRTVLELLGGAGRPVAP
jgi:two-component system nitrate/nitrite response regulator NarL